MFFGQPCNDLVDKAIGMADVSSGALNDDVWRVLMGNRNHESYTSFKKGGNQNFLRVSSRYENDVPG